MLKHLIGTLLIFRLELRQFHLDPQLVLLLWRQRPTIEIVFDERRQQRQPRQQLLEKLDEVYPF